MNIPFMLSCRDEKSILLIYSYIIGKAIQSPFKWYITLNAQAIYTDVVDYISTIPPKIRRVIYAKRHRWGGGVPRKKGVNIKFIPIKKN